MARRSGKVTIHDIAHALGLNASTVSRALADNPVVSQKTRELVQRKAEELNYQPNHMAAALRRGRSNILGVVIPAIDQAFFGAVIRGIEERAEEDNYRIIVSQTYDSYERERTMIRTLRRAQVDGVIISSAKDPNPDPSFYHQLIEDGFPLHFFDSMPVGVEAPAVVIDDEAGGYAATQLLIDAGYRRIAHFRGPQDFHIYRDRYRGYLRAMAEANLSVPAGYVIDIVSHFDSGEQGFAELWRVPEKPEAIFSTSDYTAAGCMRAARQLGIRVPEELAVVGFSNEPFATIVSPQLTSVDQRCHDMGRAVAERLLRQLRGEGAEDELRHVLEPVVMVRESAPVRRKGR